VDLLPDEQVAEVFQLGGAEVVGHAMLDHLGSHHAGFGQVDHQAAQHRVAVRAKLVPPVPFHQSGGCDGLVAV